MVVRRRMILQLTSLVDLLFIVMFLQYMELQDASNRQLHAEALRRQRAESDQRAAVELKERVLATRDGVTQQLQQFQAENRDLQQRLDEANRRIATATLSQQEEEKKSYRDLQSIAGVVKDMLGVPQETMMSVLRGAPETERARLRERLEGMKNEPPARLVQHLRETAELKKYCEIWQVHVYSDNSVGIQIGGENVGERFFVRNDSEVANRVVAAAKEHGEPKSLVILCLTWADAELITRERVSKGLQSAVIVLKSEWGGGKRIELARLGYSETP